MKRYIKIEGEHYLKINVFYDKGGINFLTGRTDARGYWLSVTAVKRETYGLVQMESFEMFTSGYKELILEVKRRSDKAHDKAVDMSESMWRRLAEKVLVEKGFAVSLKTLENQEAA